MKYLLVITLYTLHLFIFLTAILFLITSLIQSGFIPQNWSGEARFTFGVIDFIIGVGSIVFSVIVKDTESNPETK